MGRCIVTEHRHFVLFNIYAPLHDEHSRLHFFEELVDAMRRFRSLTKKPVILAGDLNMTISTLDRHYELLKLHVPSLIFSEQLPEDLSPDVQKLLNDMKAFWPRFKQALRGKTPVSRITVANSTGKSRRRLGMKVPWNGASIRIGTLWDSEEAALSEFIMAEISDEIKLEDLRKAYAALTGKFVKKTAWKGLSDRFGNVLTETSVLNCVKKMMSVDNMIDVHRAIHPDMKFRYTCWRQDKNRRFENIGSKLDYFVIDASLRENVTELANPDIVSVLKCACKGKGNGACQSQEEAGLCAVTAGNLFRVGRRALFQFHGFTSQFVAGAVIWWWF